VATHRFMTVESTQRIGRVLARDPSTIGDRVVARSQRGGEGQREHTWASPEGGLYLSLIRRSPRAAPPLLPLTVGLAICELLEERWKVPAKLRWPNDVVASSRGEAARKLCGVLVDGVETNTARARCVIGIGVNVAPLSESVPREVRRIAGSLADWVDPLPDLSEVEEQVVRAVDARLLELETPGGVRTVVTRARSRLYGRGKPARIDGRPAGRIDSLGDGGELLLLDGVDLRPIVAGELTIEEES
jgi:BirA family biotin operon repressor/biotin-[acetyl-CoA-carboxylase] ligase